MGWERAISIRGCPQPGQGPGLTKPDRTGLRTKMTAIHKENCLGEDPAPDGPRASVGQAGRAATSHFKNCAIRLGRGGPARGLPSARPPRPPLAVIEP